MMIDNASDTFNILYNIRIVFFIQKKMWNTWLIYIIYNNILNSIYAWEVFIFINIILYPYCLTTEPL